MIAKEATPFAMTTRDIEKSSAEDPKLHNIRSCLLTGRWDKLTNKEFLSVRQELSCIGKLILRGTRIVIPESLREQVMKLGHEGHPGIVGMKQCLRSKL